MVTSKTSQKIIDIPGVGVVLFKGDKVLLVRHEEGAGHMTGVYGLPAGRFLKGETAKQVALRELFEETGITTTEIALIEYPENIYIGTFKRKETNKDVTASLRVFICTEYSGTLKNSQETTPKWVAISEMEKLDLLPNVAKAIRDAQKYV